MATWRPLVGTADLTGLQATTDLLQASITGLSAAVETVATAVSLLDAFPFEPINPLDTLVSSLVESLRQTVSGLQETGVSLAVHVNLGWNPAWRLARVGYEDAGQHPDYINDGVLPWFGTGIEGWLSDVLMSTVDPGNVFRPVSDQGTGVAGAIIVVGSPGGSSIAALHYILKLFAPTKTELDLAFDFDKANTKQGVALARMGMASVSSTFTEALGGLTSDWQSLVSGDSYADYIAAMEERGRSIDPLQNGSMPAWLSVNVWDVMPLLGSFCLTLLQIAEALDVGASAATVGSAVVDVLREKVELLRWAVEELSLLVDELADALVALDDAYILVLNNNDGGMVKFFSDALRAEDLPSFGEDGVVAGAVLVGTSSDASTHIEAFFNLLKLDFQSLCDTTTAQAEQLLATWDKYF